MADQSPDRRTGLDLHFRTIPDCVAQFNVDGDTVASLPSEAVSETPTTLHWRMVRGFSLPADHLGDQSSGGDDGHFAAASSASRSASCRNA
jgi:hypothetical protein